MPSLREDQSLTYGAAWADVYDRVFPAVTDTHRAVAHLRGLVPAGGRVLELGVGTGRVAVPLALAGLDVTGVDSSPEMLDVARRSAAERGVTLTLELGDIRTWRTQRQVDLVLCICATLSMLADEVEQLQVLAGAAHAVRPGGTVVVETHAPERVRRLHASGPLSTLVPVPTLPGGLRSRSRLSASGESWQVEHEWDDGGALRRTDEVSRLIEPSELRRSARRAGLVPCSTYTDWGGTAATDGAADPHSPTYISTFRRP